MTKSRILYAASLLAAIFFLIFYIGYFSMFLLLFLLCVPLCTFFLLLPAYRNFSAVLAAPEKPVCCGEAAVFSLTAQCRSRIPTGTVCAKILCRNTLTGETFWHRVRLSPIQGKSALELPIISPYCGKLEVTVTRLTVCDLFGIFSLRYHLPEIAAACFVLPKIPEFLIPFSPKADMGNKSDEYDLYHPGNDLSELFAVREYRPGDSPHSIHWKLTEKRGILMVRQGSLPLPAGPDILVELQEASPAALSCAAETALALSSAMLSQGRQHHVLWLGGTELQSCAVRDEDSTVQMTAWLLSAHPQKQAAAFAAYPTTSDRQLLYVTSAVPVVSLPEATVTFCCAPIETNAGSNLIAVTPGHIEEALQGLTL